MSDRPNFSLVGLFVLGAFFLAILCIVLFGSRDWFTRTENFVVFFDESVNGLDIGAPVKFNGVPIGEVAEIHIGFNFEDNETQIPVVLTVDVNHLYDGLGFSRKQDFKSLCEQAVKHGLRARLQYQSFLTGLLFVDLNYFPDHLIVNNNFQHPFRCPVIPTMSSGAGEMLKVASSMIEKLTQVNFVGIGKSLDSILHRLDYGLQVTDFDKLNRDFLQTLNDIRDLINLPDLRLMIVHLKAVSESAHQNIGPLVIQLNNTLCEAQEAFERVGTGAMYIESMLDPNANFRYHLEESVKNIQFAALAIRRLADLLEQNPAVLLTGKP